MAFFCWNDILPNELHTFVMSRFTPYLYYLMSLSFADVPGYKRRKGKCYGTIIRLVKKKKVTPQECGKLCTTTRRCKAFEYDADPRTYYGCLLKFRSCKTPRTKVGNHIFRDRYIYDRCKSFEADMMFFIFLQLVLYCAPDILLN